MTSWDPPGSLSSLSVKSGEPNVDTSKELTVSNLDTSILKPGDVVVVEMGIWIIRVLIWIQALFSGNFKYRQNGHVIVVSHTDDAGRLWGIEGRPGGIGWADLTKRNGKYGISTAEQPKTNEQRALIVSTMEQLLGTRYDYEAYLDIAFRTIGITTTWKDYQGEDVPVQFICSAVADWVYEQAGLANPGKDEITRYTTPAQWGKFIDNKEWEQVA
jgi:hypothetical protein